MGLESFSSDNTLLSAGEHKTRITIHSDGNNDAYQYDAIRFDNAIETQEGEFAILENQIAFYLPRQELLKNWPNMDNDLPFKELRADGVAYRIQELKRDDSGFEILICEKVL